MFKYLWIVVIFALYLWWAFEAIKGLIEEIKFAKKYHREFKFDYLPYVTCWYILIHAIVILAWSVVEFILYYS